MPVFNNLLEIRVIRKKLGTEFARGLLLKKVIIKKSFSYPPAAVLYPGTAVNISETKKEAVRKSIHLLIALSPALAAFNYQFTVLFLIMGVLSYTAMELMRLIGVKVPLVSVLTSMASRQRERNRFVLGPVTLGLGALATLLLFPLPVACIGIYALAFGDGLSGLVGKMYGRVRPDFLFGKSLEGSATCFTATYVSAWLASHSHIVSLAAAITATVVEALPLEDYDNIALPLIVGIVVQLVL